MQIKLNNLTFQYSEFWDLLGIIETNVIDIYRSYLIKPNHIVYDLGAGIGDFTILAEKNLGNNGKIVSIEPNPLDYNRLVENIQINNCKNVVPFNLGIGDHETYSSINFKSQTFHTKIVTLKDIMLLANDDKIDFLKMDVEGVENVIISNSMDVIKKSTFISLELHGNQINLIELLKAEGFQVKFFTQKEIKRRIVSYCFRHILTAITLYKSMRKVKNYNFRNLLNRYLNGFNNIEEAKLMTAVFFKSSVSDLVI